MSRSASGNCAVARTKAVGNALIACYLCAILGRIVEKRLEAFGNQIGRAAVQKHFRHNFFVDNEIWQRHKSHFENALEKFIRQFRAVCAVAHHLRRTEHGGFEGSRTRSDESGSRGSNVSGGQKQRLCIARALLKKPKILILDDSTSAVDTHTDAMIRKAFKEEIPGTTKLIIAQRISSIQDSNIIIVMENGQVACVGDHETLMKNSDFYRGIYESQQKGSED